MQSGSKKVTCDLQLNGSVAQLDRASHYGSEGFEVLLCRMFLNGSVAQLNRALDYGSRGFR
ncbi:hypothetical protein, partial [Ferruginibacter sp.]|uniref:hypothetical protein n=1 Tax=Ferruginibacter sp. TaxID=1940288 RepID=UPI00374D2C06